jgi:WD40 repeat protein
MGIALTSRIYVQRVTMAVLGSLSLGLTPLFVGVRQPRGEDRRLRLSRPVELSGPTGVVATVAWAPNDQEIAAAYSDGFVRIWDAQMTTLLASLACGGRTPLAAAWSPNGTQILGGCRNGSLLLWDTQRHRMIWRGSYHSEDIYAVAWRPDGTMFAAATIEGNVLVWNARNRKRVASLQSPGTATSLTWRPDGGALAVVNWKGLVSVWDVGDWRPMEPLEDRKEGQQNAAATCSLRWSRNGRHLAVVSPVPNRITIWSDGKITQRLPGGPRNVMSSSLDWSADSAVLAYKNATGLSLWYRTSGQEHPIADTGDVTSVAWSAQGRRLAAGFWSGNIRVWSVQAGS